MLIECELSAEIQHQRNQATCRSSSKTTLGCLKSQHLRSLRSDSYTQIPWVVLHNGTLTKSAFPLALFDPGGKVGMGFCFALGTSDENI